MSARRLELDRPAAVVLRPLGRERLGRPVVGDSGGEQRDIDVRERERRVEHRLGGRRRDRLDPVRRADRQVRREQDHLGAAPACLLGERDAHPAGGAVAEEADAVERLARAARGDEDAPAGKRAGREQLRRTRAAISSGSARRPTPHSPSAISPSSGPTSSTPRARSASTFARVAGCAHMRGFMAGATSTGPRCASAASVSTLSAMPCASFASVFAVQGATTSRSARVRCG